TPPLPALHSVGDVSADKGRTGKVSRAPKHTLLQISERGNNIEAHESHKDMPMSEPLPALDALARASRQTAYCSG
ncbi:hypothetical protein BD310DRAFT_931715, partial [Dichomitus squalens]